MFAIMHTGRHAHRSQPLSAAGPAAPVRVLLVGMYGQRGGGIGRMMEYLEAAPMQGFRFERVESRGGGHILGSVRFMFAAAWRIVRAACGGTPAIVHVNMAERGSVLRKGALLLLARALGLPTVLHLHAAELIPSYERLPRPGRALLAIPFRTATVCVVLGTVWRDFLSDRLHIPASRIEVLRNAVPRPVLRRFPAPTPTFHFVFLGNLHARKGLADLLHALADARLDKLDWSLTIAGGGNATRFKILAAALGIQARVAFTGWLDREAATYLLTQSHALVLPSYAEGLPLVLLEAASLGLPIVATPVGAIGEVFTDRHTALLVAPGNRAALAGALLALVTEPGCAALLGGQAHALYRQGYTMDAFTACLNRIYALHCPPAAPAGLRWAEPG